MENHMSRRPDARTGQHRHDATAAAELTDRILAGRLLVLAPHMDDETLACGGTLFLHGRKRDVHCLFATDGAASPAPALPWQGRPDEGLAARRRAEAVAAAAVLGIGRGNLQFLDLPDGGLAARRGRLVAALAAAVASLRPDFVLAPFRYDVHPDHIALNRAIRAVLRDLPSAPVLLEYFVYHRLRFFPGGDVRRAVPAGRMVEIDTRPAAAAKRAALECYVSQVALIYPWQDQPVLADAGLQQRCLEPEVFLPTDPAASLTDGLGEEALRVRLATFAMRFSKRPKDRAVALARWVLGR
jgi:LmbE family N-acetylglucosaminyl deacetylase